MMAITYSRSTSENPDFLDLVRELDADLAFRDGDDHAFYAKLNKTGTLKHVVVAYSGNQALGCGAIRPFADDTVEVKRMFVVPAHRGQGIASGVLSALERWAAELGFQRCILETGKRQPEAISLYLKKGYQIIPNFGHYENVDNSVCFGKKLANPQ